MGNGVLAPLDEGAVECGNESGQAGARGALWAT